MCRVVAYLGRPIQLAHVLYETDSSLVTQTYRPQMLANLNLAGFGMAVWNTASPRPDEPLVYRTTKLPAFDPNLRNLSWKLETTCLLAHVRGVTLGRADDVSEQNVHPFRFPGAGVAVAHNGHLREFARMRYDLIEHIRPEIASSIGGSTDSEWLSALVVSQLETAAPDAEQLVDAVVKAFRVLREVRARHGIATSSPVNLFLSTGECLVATRFSFDYGWFPEDDVLLEIDLPYASLWYTAGERYAEHDGEWEMVGDGPAESFLIGSEPLTKNTSTWLEMPEYAVLSASLRDGIVETECHDVDV
jgi:glutamine amidotransferase